VCFLIVIPSEAKNHSSRSAKGDKMILRCAQNDKTTLFRAPKVETVPADMLDMDISAIAAQGLDQAETQLEQAASDLAGAGLSSDGSNIDTVDLSAAVVGLISAKDNFNVNATVMKTAEEIQQSTLDVMA